MNRQPSQFLRARRAKFRPALECLEDRTVPAATLSIDALGDAVYTATTLHTPNTLTVTMGGAQISFHDSVNVINFTGPPSFTGSGTHTITGPVSAVASITVENPPSVTALQVDDSADTTGRTVVLDQFTPVGDTAFGSITGLPSGPINYEDNDTSTVSLTLGSGDDEVDVRATSVPVSINANGGMNLVNVGSVAPQALGNVGAIRGPVSVGGTNGQSILAVLNAADVYAHSNVVVGTGFVTGLAPAPIFWTPSGANTPNNGVRAVAIDVNGIGDDTVTVNDPGPQALNFAINLSYGAGNNMINVRAITSPTFIEAAYGTNTVTVGSKAPLLGGTLAAINAPLLVFSGAGHGTALVLDDSGDVASTNATIADGVVTGLGPQPIQYTYPPDTPVSSVKIFGGSHGNTFNVQSTPADVPVTLYTGLGNDTVTVQGPAGTLDPIQGSLTVHGQGGLDTLHILDLGSTSAQAFTLTSTPSISSLTRSGPGPINYDTQVENTDIRAGSGDDTFTLVGKPAIPVTLDGGTGINGLTGPNVTNLWQIETADGGVLDIKVTFASMQHLSGGAANDTFTMFPGGSLQQNIDGGLGSNTLDYHLLGDAIDVSTENDSAPGLSHGGLSGGFNHIDSFIGTDLPNSVFTGPRLPTLWKITDTDRGVAGAYHFAGFMNLVGSSEMDIFQFSFNPLGSVTGRIDGGPGGNWLDYSLYPSTHPVSVNLTTGAATAVGLGVTNVQNVTGGAGNDNLTGSPLGSILLGGPGSDTLNGGGGRSLLIGGLGRDTLTGGSSGDLLIGGTTSYDNKQAALLALFAEWQSPDAYDNRVAKLRDGFLVNGVLTRLAIGVTVFDDGAADRLIGAVGPDQDWFFKSPSDTIMQFEAGEFIN
jgi:hypothetical protein